MRFITYLYKEDVNRIKYIGNSKDLNGISEVKNIFFSLKIPLVSNRFSYIILNLKNLEDIYAVYIISNRDINKILSIFIENYIYIGELNVFKNRYKNLLSKKCIELITKLNKSNKLVLYKELIAQKSLTLEPFSFMNFYIYESL